ncbi:MAG: DUF6149 family protein [Halobacteriaceae archaeon]
MKLRQSARHFAAKTALQLPVVGNVAHDRLVDLHVDVFAGRAPEACRDERRAHLRAFFDGSMDMYLAALEEGYPEAEAREITHIVANFDFFNHGWTEMMEFPADEIDDHYDRYADFFERHRITVDDPLGEFAPDEVPEAPATPAKLDDPEFENAEGGYADAAYVDDGEEVREADGAEPDAVDVTDAPGIDGDTSS